METWTKPSARRQRYSTVLSHRRRCRCAPAAASASMISSASSAVTMQAARSEPAGRLDRLAGALDRSPERPVDGVDVGVEPKVVTDLREQVDENQVPVWLELVWILGERRLAEPGHGIQELVGNRAEDGHLGRDDPEVGLVRVRRRIPERHHDPAIAAENLEAVEGRPAPDWLRAGPELGLVVVVRVELGNGEGVDDPLECLGREPRLGGAILDGLPDDPAVIEHRRARCRPARVAARRQPDHESRGCGRLRR